MFVLQVLGVVIFVYGLLSLIQDIFNEITYKKISHNMKIIIFAKELEKNIEHFLIEISNMKKVNSYSQMTIIDLEEKDDIDKVKTRLANNDINIDVLSGEEGKKYINQII